MIDFKGYEGKETPHVPKTYSATARIIAALALPFVVVGTSLGCVAVSLAVVGMATAADLVIVIRGRL